VSDNNSENSIYELFLRASAEKLREGVEQVDGLSKKDIEIACKEKDDDYHLGKLIKGLKGKIFCLVAILAAALLVAGAIILTILVIRYVALVWNNPLAIHDLMKIAFQWLFGGAATVCLQKLKKVVSDK